MQTTYCSTLRSFVEQIPATYVYLCIKLVNGHPFCDTLIHSSLPNEMPNYDNCLHQIYLEFFFLQFFHFSFFILPFCLENFFIRVGESWTGVREWHIKILSLLYLFPASVKACWFKSIHCYFSLFLTHIEN